MTCELTDSRVAQHRDHYNRIADEYSALMKGPPHLAVLDIDAQMRTVFVQQIGHHLGPTILEVCCGPGNFTRVLARYCPWAGITACDLSEGLIDVARRESASPNVRFEVQDATRLPYPSGRFDTVVLCLALHEMPPTDIRAILAEAARVLAPGGKAAVIEHHVPENPLLQWLHQQYVLFPGERDTTASLNRHGLPRYLEEAGLALREFRILGASMWQIAVAEKGPPGPPFFFRDWTSVDPYHHVFLPFLRALAPG